MDVDEEEKNGEQEQQQNKNNYDSTFNVGHRAAQSAQNFSENAQNASQKLGNAAGSFREKAQAKEALSQTQKGAEAAKNAKKAQEYAQRAEKLEKAAAKVTKAADKAKKFAEVATRIGKYLTVVGVIILIIIAIIGLLTFIITGWGMLMQNFKEIGEALYDGFVGVIQGKENNIKEDEMITLMNDIEEMGYDLYDYGFVGGAIWKKEKKKDEAGNDVETDKFIKKYYDEENLKLDDTLKEDEAYKYLTTYMYSDNYAYMIKNNNHNFKTALSSLKNFLGGTFNSNEWGSGLISLWIQKENNDGKITGIKGEVYGIDLNDLSGYAQIQQEGFKGGLKALFENATIITKFIDNWAELTSSIKIDRNAETLNISTVGVQKDLIFSYNLDGWTGRYSMPLEFLLATHVATMAPDLSYKLATSFNTDVEILLYKAKGETTVGGVKTDNGTVITKEQIDHNFLGIVTAKNAVEIFKNNSEFNSIKEGTEGVDSKFICMGPSSIEPNKEFSDAISEVLPELTVDKANEVINDLINESFDDVDKLKYKDTDTKWVDNPVFIKDDDFLNFTKENQIKTEDGENGVMMEDEYGAWVYKEGNYYIKDNEDATDKGYYKNIKKLSFDVEPDDDEEDYDLPCDVYVWVLRSTTQPSEDTYHDTDEDGTEYYYSIYLTSMAYEIVKNDENYTCSEFIRAGNDLKRTCNHCRNYLNEVYKAVNNATKIDYDIFKPYINCVTDHWYRDVFFTKAAMDDNNVSEIISVDKEDEERWTEYELDPDGNYELYVYFKTQSEQYSDEGQYEGEFAKIDDKYVICREVGEGKGSYILAKEGETRYTYEGANKGNYELKILDQPTSNDKNVRYSTYTGEYKPKEFKVGKKAKMSDQELSNDWTAYTVGSSPSSSGWKELAINDDTPEYVKNLKTFGLTAVYNTEGKEISQVEDGLRGATNPKIKKLFLDDYYLYDGTEQRAALIQQAKINVKDAITYSTDHVDEVHYSDPDDPDTYKKLVSEGKLDKNIYAKKNNNEYTATIDQISGSINILQDSLTAFSILRNMHTLDAEYIYHDFKELIVELDYFDKEDLVESETETMMFPIAGIGSASWPLARYDKKEEYYGTLIHSAEDYKCLEAETLAELKELIGEEVSFDDSELATKNTNIVSASNSKTNSSNNPLLLAAEDIHKYMEDNKDKYYYGPLSDASGYKQGLGKSTESSFEESQNSTASIKTCDCSTFVSWVLQEVGIFEKGQKGTDTGITDIIQGINSSWIMTNITSNDLQAGDIIFVSNHTQIFAGYSDNGTQTWYNAGSTGSIWDDSPKEYNFDFSKRPLRCIVRIPADKMTYNGVTGTSNSSQTEGVFTGYAGGEPVIAPVTGEVIKYGKIKRQNIESSTSEETVEEEVGFIKIRVLNAAEKEFFDNNKDGEKGFRSFIKEYSDAGITDHVVYIEGFDVDSILGENVVENIEANRGKNITTLGKYIEDHSGENAKEKFDYYNTTYVVPKLLDKVRQSELEGYEEDKKNAKYVITKKDSEGKNRIYIKEGAVIGFTYGTGEMPSEEKDTETEETTESTTDETKDKKEKKKKDKTSEDKDEDKKDETTQNGRTPKLNDGVREMEVTVPVTTKKEEGTEDNSNSSNDTNSSSDEEENKEETKTYTVGNYIRVIMRDTKEQVVENVEDYVEKGETKSNLSVSQEYQAWEGDLELLAEVIHHEAGYDYLKALSNRFDSDQDEADFEMYCMGYSVVNKLLEQNKTWYGHLYDESRTDRSPLAQVVTSAWYGVRNDMEKYINGGPSHYTAKELEYAEYCLTYDCTSVQKPNETKLGSFAKNDGYTVTPVNSVIPRAMCQQGGYGDGAPGQSNIILVGYWDYNNNDEFDKGDELWGVDRIMESLIDSN